jgi:hypothetical protein
MPASGRLVERSDTTGIETGVIARAQGVFFLWHVASVDGMKDA